MFCREPSRAGRIPGRQAARRSFEAIKAGGCEVCEHEARADGRDYRSGQREAQSGQAAGKPH